MGKVFTIMHVISSGGLFGAENVILNLSKGLNDRGYKSCIVVLNNIHNPHLEIIEAAQQRNLVTFVIGSKGKIDLSAIGQLRSLIRKNNIDVLHTHNYKSDIIGLIAAWLERIPIVATAHGFTDVTKNVSFYERCDRWALKVFFRKVITVTANMFPGLSDHKRRVIPNGVDVAGIARDVQKVTAFRQAYNIREDDFVIGSVGRLSKEKNQRLLLEAVASWVKSNDRFKVVLIGDGPEMEHLRKYCEKHDLSDKVIFTGVLNDMICAYSAMDISVLCSLTEGIPLTVLESMASKVPVIATRVGGIPDIICDGVNGLLLDSHNPDTLRNRIQYLMENMDKRDQISKLAYVYVHKHHSVDGMCSAYRQVYKEVLN